MSAHATRVVIVEHSRGEAPMIIGTGVSETRGLRHGYIVNKSDAVRSIRTAITNAERMAALKLKRYSVVGAWTRILHLAWHGNHLAHPASE